MADGRKRSEAKQARRDARRRKAQRQGTTASETPEEAPLIDEVRAALDGGQPMDLLGLVGMVVAATAPQQPVLVSPSDDEAPPRLDELVAAFIDVRVPETTALLAVLGELVVGDDVLRESCRREVGARDDPLPRWLALLGETTVPRTVRMSHVLGDGDELLLGVRLADGRELTCAVFVNHLAMSKVEDAFFVPEAIDVVLGVAQASNTDPDTSFVDLDPAETRSRLLSALEHPPGMFTSETDTWPSTRPLVNWLTTLMPVAEPSLQVSQHDTVRGQEFLERFFDSRQGAPFDDTDHRELLESCIEEGTGDPLRWSAARLMQLLGTAVVFDDVIPVQTQLDVPELLRAFVPFAHAESGIRQELTDEALEAIDEAVEGYRDEVLEEARHREHDGDDGDRDEDDE
jgi:hypothetical protein